MPALPSLVSLSGRLLVTISCALLGPLDLPVMYVSVIILKVKNTENSTQAAGQPYLMSKYKISANLASSGLSLNVLGMAMGPLLCVYF